MKIIEQITSVLLGAKNPTWINYVIAIPLYGLVLLFFFPSLLLPNKTIYENYTVYSAEPIDPSIKKILDTCSEKLAESEIYNPHKKHTFYFCEGFTYAKFFGLMSYKAFGWNRWNDIFIVKTDIKNDLCFRNDVWYNVRPLSEVLAHEVIHTFQSDEWGMIKMKMKPTWKTEGYAEYIVKPKPFDLLEARKTLSEIQDNHTPGADYIRYHIAVQYLFEKKKMNFQQLTDTALDLEDVLNSIIKE